MQVSWLDAKGIGNAASNNGESVLVLGLKEENHNITVTCRADNKVAEGLKDRMDVILISFANVYGLLVLITLCIIYRQKKKMITRKAEMKQLCRENFFLPRDTDRQFGLSGNTLTLKLYDSDALNLHHEFVKEALQWDFENNS